jgi:hypothetical protein
MLVAMAFASLLVGDVRDVNTIARHFMDIKFLNGLAI